MKLDAAKGKFKERSVLLRASPFGGYWATLGQ